MECVSCEMEVSPSFVSAIAENKCPACGKQLMDSGEYKKIFALKKLLSGLSLGLEDSTLVKLSAAISSKFELWPKDMSTKAPQLTESAASGGVASDDSKPAKPLVSESSLKQQKKDMVARLSNAMDAAENSLFSIDEDEPSDFDEDADLSPEQKRALMAEFGLLNDPSEASPHETNILSDEISAMMAEEPLGGDDEDPMSADRLKRARSLKGSASASYNKFGVKPITRIS